MSKIKTPVPYTYLIGWRDLNVWYYGVKYARNCHPTDFWVTYFTSSKQVAKFIIEHGDPDVIKIRKVFDNTSIAIENRITQARLWEETVLKRMKVLKSNNWLNRTDRAGPVGLGGKLNPMYGKSAIADKNLKWYNNGIDNVYVTEGTQPAGYKRGRLLPSNYTRPQPKHPCVSPKGEIFESLQEAAKVYNITVPALRERIRRNEACNKPRKNKSYWSFYSDEQY